MLKKDQKVIQPRHIWYYMFVREYKLKETSSVSNNYSIGIIFPNVLYVLSQQNKYGKWTRREQDTERLELEFYKHATKLWVSKSQKKHSQVTQVHEFSSWSRQRMSCLKDRVSEASPTSQSYQELDKRLHCFATTYTTSLKLNKEQLKRLRKKN